MKVGDKYYHKHYEGYEVIIISNTNDHIVYKYPHGKTLVLRAKEFTKLYNIKNVHLARQKRELSKEIKELQKRLKRLG